MKKIVVLAMLATLLPVAAADAASRNGRIYYRVLSDLYSVKADGSANRHVAEEADVNELSASPDGRSLVSPAYQRLRLLSTSDGSQVGEVPLPGRDWLNSASWRPDGKELAFSACEREVFTDISECVDYGVFRVLPDGTEVRRVGEGFAPSWSRSGRSLVHIGKVRERAPDGNECWGIYVSRRDGTPRRRVLPRRRTCGLGSDVARPFFSANGRRVYFIRYVAHRGVLRGRLMSVKLDGTGLRQVVRRRSPRFSVNLAALSPDGRRIAFGAARNVYVVDARRGGPRRRIARHSYYAGSLAWAPVPSG